MEKKGVLIAVEGVEGSGRSTHVQGIKEFLEEEGYGVTVIGLQSSQLLGGLLGQVKRELVFQRFTLFLAYATDLADQIEYTVKEALNSGFVVLADGYIYTLMAWGLTRGLDKAWLNDVLSFAVKPDLAISLVAPANVIIRRVITKNGKIDPLKSSIDLCINRDLYASFRAYVKTFQKHLVDLSRENGLRTVRTDRSFEEVNREIANYVREVLG